MPSSTQQGSDQQQKKLIAIAAVGGAAVVLGATWYYMRRRQESEAGPKLSRKAPLQGSQAAGVAQEKASAVASSHPPSSVDAVEQNAFSGDNARQQPKPLKPYQPPVADAEGKITFGSLGVTVQLARDWNATEEASPMPNVALIAFGKPEFSEREVSMPGAVPIVLLSIEDVSNEKVTVEEFKEKSKMVALSQMAMMTGGQMMPNVREDERLQQPIGPFTHLLMYELRTPGFGLQVMNLTTLQDGMAYIFQLMANPDEFSAARKDVVQMARSMSIERRPEPADFVQVSYIAMASAGGSVKVPSQWTIDKAVAINPVFVASTPSQQRKEVIEVYNVKLEKSVDLSKAVKKATRVVRGVTVDDFGSSMRVATHRDAIVVATAKHAGDVLTSAETLAAIALNVDFSAKSDDDRQHYFNATLDLGFEKRSTGRIIESRLSERVVVYAPMGLPTDPSATDDFPMLTLRTGDPSNDPDCRTSLDEWMQRVREETESDAFTDLKREVIAGRECITFMTKEMQEVGPQQREERTAKMIIFLTGIRTTFLRWECPSGAWRKHEGKLKSLLNSLRLPAPAS